MKISVVVVLLVIACACAFAERVEVGDVRDVGLLDLQMESEGFVSSENSYVIKIDLDVSDIDVFSAGDTFDAFSIDELRTNGVEGEPRTYVKGERIELPGDARVTGVRILDGEYVDITRRITLAPEPPALSPTKGLPRDGLLRKDNRTYGRDAFFPGRTVSYMAGRARDKTIVYVQFYPIQYNPVQKRAICIRTARLEISYSIEPAVSERTPSFATDARNIIITSNAFQSRAENLKDLHESLEKVPSHVVTTEWIAATYEAAEDPVQPGYATVSPSPVSEDYDYELAGKIIAYLRDVPAHPQLESVTIFGDDAVVPPSYYFFIDHYTDYNNWIPSDLFYASPDYDFALDYEIGRLPVSNSQQAGGIIQKYKTWKNNLSDDWFQNVRCFGGSTFDTKYLYGELNVLDAVNKGYFSGMEVDKHFLSNGGETRQNLLNHFSDENTGILFCSGHGTGVSFLMSSGTISTSDITGMPPKSKFPILFMVACLNGSYDSHLMNNRYDDCFGETVLFAQGGTVAFWGSARTAFVSYDFLFDEQGELIINGSRYLAGMMVHCARAYSEGHHRLGALTREAFEGYFEAFNDRNMLDYHVAYEFIFLGDPVFSLPSPGNSPSYERMELTLHPRPDINGGGFEEAVYCMNSSVKPSVTITTETASPSVDVRVFRRNGSDFTVLDHDYDVFSPHEYFFEPQTVNSFMLSFSAGDGGESRLYLRTKTAANIPPSQCTLHDIEYCGENCFTVTWSPSRDSENDTLFYSVMEAADPVRCLETCDSLDNWTGDGFTVSATGHDGSPCFYSGGGNDRYSAITTMDPVDIETGDELIFWKKYNTEECWDFAYVEISTDGEEYTILESYTGSSAVWSESRIDLSEYAGRSVFLRFRYRSDFVYSGTGFYVDDIYPAVCFQRRKTVSGLRDTSWHVENAADGTYLYSVQATDANGSNSAWSDILRMTLPCSGMSGRLNPFFSGIPTTGHRPLRVQFTDRSIPDEPLTSWAWDLDGDGLVDITDRHPEWIYEEPGTYTVALAVTSASLSESRSFQEYIHVFDGESALFVSDMDSYVACPAGSECELTGDFTIEAWLNPQASGMSTAGAFLTTSRISLSIVDSQPVLSDHSLLVMMNHTDGFISLNGTPEQSITFGLWQHVAVTYESITDTVTVYIDSIRQPLIQREEPSGPVGDKGDSDLILGNGPGDDDLYCGLIDEVRVWGSVRSEDDIREQMDSYLCGFEPGLLSYWPMNEGNGETVVDYSGGGHDGLVAGCVWREGVHLDPATTDYDGDGILNTDDNCPGEQNPGQEDRDEDGRGDACDNCPDDQNSGQADADGDGAGDLCDGCTDTDGDGFSDPDFTGGACEEDNCPDLYNPDQAPVDMGDIDCLNGVNVLDIMTAVNHILNTAPLSGQPFQRADCNGDGQVDVIDVVGIVNVVLGWGTCGP